MTVETFITYGANRRNKGKAPMIYYLGQSKVDTEAATLNVAGVDFYLPDLVVSADEYGPILFAVEDVAPELAVKP